jgi:hypothetical protein
MHPLPQVGENQRGVPMNDLQRNAARRIANALTEAQSHIVRTGYEKDPEKLKASHDAAFALVCESKSWAEALANDKSS